MLSPLKHPAYRRLFGAQVAALLGTGLATVALGLLAHDLAGAQAGEVLGAALTIKMICYVGAAPFASAISANVPRKVLLIGLDVVRAGIALALPFVDAAWQVYALMAVLYLASAAFTPAFQAMIPDILKDEAEYTKALSLSRLAADLESVASPVLAALLLAFMTYNNLFVGTAFGFVGSALLVGAAPLPPLHATATRPFLKRLTAGLNLFLHTPRLRALIALSLASAAGGAMAFVNTVVMVQSYFALGQRETAWALAAFGGGSMIAALLLPRLLGERGDRAVLLTGTAAMAILLTAGTVLVQNYPSLIALWFALGSAYSLTLTPIGRVLRRSSHAEERPALFAAHFAVSHAAWLVAYPTAGFVSAAFGASTAFIALAVLCGVGAVSAAALWSARDPEIIEHTHDDLAPDHPHLEGRSHEHPYVIDALHPRWPRT